MESAARSWWTAQLSPSAFCTIDTTICLRLLCRDVYPKGLPAPATRLTAMSVVHVSEGGQGQQLVQAVEQQVTARSQCANCGEGGFDMHRCSACQQVAYCGRNCQKAHWKEHKPQCTRKTAAAS